MIEIRSKEYVNLQTDLLKQRVTELINRGIQPKIVIILCGDDGASASYARTKTRFADKIGVAHELITCPNETTTEELLAIIKQYNEDPSVHGIMIEMPLPKHIDVQKVNIAIDPGKDVDAIHPVHLGNLLAGDHSRVPNTPLSAITLMDEVGTVFKGKRAVMVGRSTIVGKPLAELMLQRGATVTIAHSQTENMAALTRSADIICVAVGIPNFLTEDMVSPGATVIDIGTTYDENGKVTGDVDYANVAEKTHAITPVPGGVGPVTKLMVFKQMIDRLEEVTDIV
jgi:methylenetetrahydrofolate dehydrogenase (NADP+)/methenyltetrahydrofolate cyclohydrolase